MRMCDICREQNISFQDIRDDPMRRVVGRLVLEYDQELTPKQRKRNPEAEHPVIVLDLCHNHLLEMKRKLANYAAVRPGGIL